MSRVVGELWDADPEVEVEDFFHPGTNAGWEVMDSLYEGYRQ